VWIMKNHGKFSDSCLDFLFHNYVDLFELPGMRIHPALSTPHLIQITLRTALMTSILADQMVKSFTYLVLSYNILQKVKFYVGLLSSYKHKQCS
jgi:hypothetical protein